MPSPIAHAVFGASLWPLFRSQEAPRRTWLIGAGLAVLPDLDFVGYVMGVPYETLMGHRGITHSILFALLEATCAWWIVRARRGGASAPFLWLYLVLASMSHSVLDACTDGGLGVAFFAPFDTRRYFLPFRPILVSPLSVERLLSMRGLRIMQNEAVWVGVPSALLFMAGRARLALASARPHPVR
jgi:inner membrane protein